MDPDCKTVGSFVGLYSGIPICWGDFPSHRGAPSRNSTGSLGAKSATTTIPIVLSGVADAVGIGLVASLARPGSKLTGFSNIVYQQSDHSGLRNRLRNQVKQSSSLKHQLSGDPNNPNEVSSELAPV